MKFCVITFLCIVAPFTVFAQSENEYYVTTSANFYIPVKNPQKGIYPILGYDENEDPKFQIGGFGLGFSMTGSLYGKFIIKGQGNISRHVYWDESFELRDPNNNPLGSFTGSTTEYTIGLTATVHYLITPKFMIGTGLGTRILLNSSSKLPDASAYGVDLQGTVRNTYYKPVLPIIPLEFSCKLKKTLWILRYEYGLLDRYRGDLADADTDKYGLLIFEVGFKIK
jgi:hypothetical protein